MNTCKIVMFAGDHNPPHFHIFANDGGKALVEIKTLSVLAGKVNAAALKEALAWAANNLALLNQTWKVLNP